MKRERRNEAVEDPSDCVETLSRQSDSARVERRSEAYGTKADLAAFLLAVDAVKEDQWAHQQTG